MHSVLPGMLTTEAGFSPGSSKHTEQGGPTPLPPRQGAGGDGWGPSMIFFPSRESLSEALNAKADCSGGRACSCALQHPMALLPSLQVSHPRRLSLGCRAPGNHCPWSAAIPSTLPGFSSRPHPTQGQDLQEGSGICVCDELPGAASRTRPRGFSFTPTPASHFEGTGLGWAPRGAMGHENHEKRGSPSGAPRPTALVLEPSSLF